MEPPSSINEITQREWRELGYFYDRYDDINEWRLSGSTAGLLKFANALQAYAADPGSELVSEHEHFGPYGYLKVGTWTTSKITDDWITGPLSELSTLTLTIASRLHVASVGDRI